MLIDAVVVQSDALAFTADEVAAVTGAAPALDVGLATSLTGEQDAAQMLDLAEWEGLGQWNDPVARTDTAVFVFSPFLRDAAQRSLRERCPLDQLRDLVLSVARWEHAHHRPFAAFRRAVECSDWDFANEIAGDFWHELALLGARLEDLCRGISLVALRARPALAMLLAVIANGKGTSRLRRSPQRRPRTTS